MPSPDQKRMKMPDLYLDPAQSRLGKPLSPYEKKLSGALAEVFGEGTHDLAGVISGLNTLGLHAPDGAPWDESRFRAEMRRLGE